MKLIAYSPPMFSVVKALRADVDWFAGVFEKMTVTTSTAQADALDSAWSGNAWQSKHWRSEPATDDLHRLRARLDAPADTSCPKLRLLLSRTFLEWALGTPTPGAASTRRDCISGTGVNARGPISGTWAALVAHHRARRPNTGALSPAAMPTFTRDRSTTVPCALYNDDAARWTVRLHAVAPHSRTPSGHQPRHTQPPAEPPHENLSALRHRLTSTCTCVLPGHGDSTPRPGRTADLAGATNRRLLHEHHLDIPSSVTSTALLDQLCPQCLHDALAPPPATGDAGLPAGDPAFVLLTWIPHDHTGTGTGTGEHEPCGRAEQPVPAGPPHAHTDPAEPDADAVLDTLKLLCDTTPSAERAVLDTVQLLGDTSLGTTRARTTRHAGSVSATADIIDRYNAKVRRHNQQRLRSHPTASTNGDTSPGASGDTGTTSS